MVIRLEGSIIWIEILIKTKMHLYIVYIQLMAVVKFSFLRTDVYCAFNVCDAIAYSNDDDDVYNKIFPYNHNVMRKFKSNNLLQT